MSGFMEITSMWGSDSGPFVEAREALLTAARGIGQEPLGQEVLIRLGEAVAIPQSAIARVQRFRGTPLRDENGRAIDATKDQALSFAAREWSEADAEVKEIIAGVPALYAELETAAEARLLGPTDTRQGDEPLWSILAERLEETDGAVMEMTRIAIGDPNALRLLQSEWASFWFLANDPKEEGATFKSAFRRFVLEQLVAANPKSAGATMLKVASDASLIAMANAAAQMGLQQLQGARSTAKAAV